MTNAYVWSNLKAEIDFLKQYPILSQATADISTPIPGYLFGEINSLTYVSNGSHCKQLVSYLLSKTQCDSPIVKIKVLKLLLYLVKNGHNNIADILKSNEVIIRELTAANGPPDPLHGRTHYGNIRHIAEELLHVIYSEENMSCFASSSNSGEKSPDGSKMGGYGSNASYKKMQGFGNTVQTPRTVGERVTESFTNIVDKMLSSGSDEQAREKRKMLLTETLPHYEPVKINKPIVEKSSMDSVSHSEVSKSNLNPSLISFVSHKKVHQFEKPGGGWDDDNEDSFESIHSDVQEILHNRPNNFDSLPVDLLSSQSDAFSNQDWLDENKIVNDFTVDQPTSALNWDEIISTCKRCTTLNCDKIIDLLISKLNNDAENTKLRALIFIEVLLHKDIVSIESLVKIALPGLQDQCQIKACPVQIKAKKICLMIKKLNSMEIPNIVK